MESSKDVLFLVLAFCIFWFTAFLCWALYYLIQMLRDASRTVKDVRDKVKMVEDLVKNIKEKLEHTAGYFGVVATAFKMLIEYFERHKAEAAARAHEAAEAIKRKVKKVKNSLEEEMEE